MKIGESCRLVLGAATIYAVMAACSAELKGGASRSDAGDAMLDPVPNADAAGSNGSGTRLKASRYVASDGANEFIEWHDSARNGEPCKFGTAADAKTRCLPAAGGIGTYSDAACAKGLVFTAPGCTAPRYGSDPVASSGAACASSPGVRIFPVLGPYTAATVWTRSGTGCTKSARGNTLDYYSVGDEIAATEFVEAAVQTDH